MKMTRTETIGSRIRELRKKAGLTQEELAFELNLESKSTISGYENDKREASHDILVEMALKLNTTVDYILRGETEVDIDLEQLITEFRKLKSKKLRTVAIKQIQMLSELNDEC